jgi:hypothetical protein
LVKKGAIKAGCEIAYQLFASHLPSARFAAHPNHAGIYLGDAAQLPESNVQVSAPDPFMLHYLLGRPSEIIVFGGSWLDRTRLVKRHRDAK